MRNLIVKVLVLVILSTLHHGASAGACTPEYPCETCATLSTVADPNDCTRYFTCTMGRVFAPQMCNRGIYSSVRHTCVIGDQTSCKQTTNFVDQAFTEQTTRTTTTTTTRRPTTTTERTTKKFISAEITTDVPIVVEPPDNTGRSNDGINSGLCGIKMSKNIVGGSGSDPGEWPWQVSIQYYNFRLRRFLHFCGGTIIANRWVMTAAHCMMEVKLPNIFVVVGNQYLSQKDPGEHLVTIRAVYKHPLYSHYGNYPNDIALLELTKDVFSWSARPACLQQSWEQTHEEKPQSFFELQYKGCWVTGWGSTLGTANQDALNEVRLSIVDQYICRSRWPGYVTNSHMCVGMGNSGACRGDSGGPLVCSKKGRFYVVGIVSWGEDTCLLKGYPNVVTRVSAFRSWIDSIVGRSNYYTYNYVG